MSATQVMIVEDESIIAMDIKSSLNRLGYAVCGIAGSGDAALRKIEINPPDLVLMDIHLKGEMTGIEVSDKIKSHLDIPVVYLTANADSSTFQSAKITDPYGYLLKPFQEKELGMTIELALHQHQKGQVVRASERWYATTFQSLSEALIATDPDGRIVYMNAAAESITECLLADVIERPIVDVLTVKRKIQDCDHIDITDSIGSILTAVMRGKTVVSLPHYAQISTQSLKTTPVEGSATAIRDAAGTIIGSLFIFRQTQVSSKGGSQMSIDTLNQLADVNQFADDRAAEHQTIESYAVDDSLIETHTDEDVALVKAFAEAFIKDQPVLLSTPNLSAQSDPSASTLSNKTEGTIVTVKSVNGKLTAIVQRNSDYWNLVRHVLIESNFFPVSQRTNGTHYFQHRTIPEQCQIYHTSASELAEAWSGKGDGDYAFPKTARNNILVLRRGTWRYIRGIFYAKEQLRIKTVGGDMFMPLTEPLIWGIQL